MKLSFIRIDLMKTTGILILFIFLVLSHANAGEIYGTIKGVYGRPLTNQVVQIMQNEKVMASAKNDANGHFTVNIKEVGKFKLEIVGYKNARFNVFSSNKSTRYNLLLNKTGDKWILKSL